MPKSLVLFFLLAGCATGPSIKYPNTGPVNATVTYRHKKEFILLRSVVINIFEADEKCQYKALGGVELDAEHTTLSLPTGRLLQVDVHIGTLAVQGPGSNHSTLFYRFRSKPGENYILEIQDDGSNKGFQIYKVEGKSRSEVPYISLGKC